MSDLWRICYFVPGALAAHPGGVAEVQRRQAYLQEHAGPGVSVEIQDNPDGPASIESPAEEQEAAAGVLEVLPRAAAGFDAVIIGCFGDPGLRAARDLVKVPVTGPAQAALHLAAQMGERIGLLTVVDGVIPVLHELVREYGLSEALASVRAVNVPVLRLRENRDEVIDRMVTEGRRCLDDGADAIVLGCMTMGFLDVAETLQEELATPVVNPVLAALHTTEMFLRLADVAAAPGSSLPHDGTER